ncbi:MAG TPA: type II toxin-antitoxin system prevent-host-death family antitoxin [Kofleriaceae bacterium]|jgi:prevent-host-death family protein|nr:type II toxin-antitoxin system prevent-host-death family antitoxin [Kofleriaceae bacterium]
MSAAAFKAKCLELMDAVERTGRSVIVTKRGHSVAMLAPVRTKRRSAFGCMKDQIEILGDIESPIDVDWDAER